MWRCETETVKDIQSLFLVMMLVTINVFHSHPWIIINVYVMM